MARKGTGAMGNQDAYKGMVKGGKSAQTGDYTAGAGKPKSFTRNWTTENRVPSHQTGHRVTGYVESI